MSLRKSELLTKSDKKVCKNLLLLLPSKVVTKSEQKVQENLLLSELLTNDVKFHKNLLSKVVKKVTKESAKIYYLLSVLLTKSDKKVCKNLLL